jgi:hypothetical protein
MAAWILSLLTLPCYPVACVQIRSSVRSARSEFNTGQLSYSVSSTYRIPVRYHLSVSIAWQRNLRLVLPLSGSPDTQIKHRLFKQS